VKIFTEHPHWTQVLEVCTQLSRVGFKAYLAGGCVRDALMMNIPNDFDVATDALPEQVQELFPQSLDVGKSFGVIIIPYEGFQIEVATFRQDFEYKDGRRPTGVQFSSPEEDAKRRDFTVNALFYDWVDNKVLDFVGGVQDIENRVIRCVGEPKLRFREDHLRIVRAIRFHSQLGFEIDHETYEAIVELAPLAADVSKERIRDEFIKLLRTSRRAAGIKMMKDTGVFSSLFPKLNSFLNSSWFMRSLETLSEPFNLTQEENLWAAMFLYIEKENLKIKDILKDLKCSNYIVSYVHKLVAGYWQSLDLNAKTSVLLRLLAQFGKDLLELHHIQGSAESGMSRWTELSQMPTELPEPWVTSDDLKQAGIAEGPKFGKILDLIFDLQLNGEVRSRDEALLRLKEFSKKNE